VGMPPRKSALYSGRNGGRPSGAHPTEHSLQAPKRPALNTRSISPIQDSPTSGPSADLTSNRVRDPGPSSRRRDVEAEDVLAVAEVEALVRQRRHGAVLAEEAGQARLLVILLRR